MNTRRHIWIGMLMSVILTACSSSSQNSDLGSPAAGPQQAAGSSPSGRLSQEYDGALSIAGQLAAGTLLVEESDLAVDELLATELLPLWQAVESLSGSDTTASVEIEAVLNEIQDTMRPEQVSAIAEMELTEDSLEAMIEDGTLALGRGGIGAGERTDGIPSGGPGFGGGIGGGPPDGVPGGGRPGGGDFGGQGLDPDAIATRQAEFAAGEGAGLLEQAMFGAVVRLLRTKTGEVTAGGSGGVFGIVFETAATATGLTVDEIQAQITDGATLAEILEASGADVTAVHGLLIEAFANLPNADQIDPEALADEWLGLEE